MAGTPTFTTKKQRKFLRVLEQTGNVSEACRQAKVSRPTVMWHYEGGCKCGDPDFKQKWDTAIANFINRLEAEADRRAVEGTLEPVFYRGVQVGNIRRYSDHLLMFRLRGMDAKYRGDKSPTEAPAAPSNYIDALAAAGERVWEEEPPVEDGGDAE